MARHHHRVGHGHLHDPDVPRDGTMVRRAGAHVRMVADAVVPGVRVHAGRGWNSRSGRGLPDRQAGHQAGRDDRHDDHGHRMAAVQPGTGHEGRPRPQRHAVPRSSRLHAGVDPTAHFLCRLHDHRAGPGARKLAPAHDYAEQLVQPSKSDGYGSFELNEQGRHAHHDSSHRMGDRPGIRAARMAF